MGGQGGAELPHLPLAHNHSPPQTKPKVNRRKEIIKIRAEINEIKTKKTIAKINKTKSWFSEKIRSEEHTSNSSH